MLYPWSSVKIMTYLKQSVLIFCWTALWSSTAAESSDQQSFCGHTLMDIEVDFENLCMKYLLTVKFVIRCLILFRQCCSHT